MYIFDLEEEKLKDVLCFYWTDKNLGNLYYYSGKHGCTTVGRAFTNKERTKIAILESETRTNNDLKGRPELIDILPKEDNWLRINNPENY